MDIDAFLKSAREGASPPEGLRPALLALWHAERGDWEQAHRVAQGDPSSQGSWVHAYLHREEGDIGNAQYWYHMAGRPESKLGVTEERHAIIAKLLG